ncbi:MULTISPECIES: STM4014 family protein [Streptomyces]|uniref:STM4014 family protein n=1 Tax=Streptomyces TaxID=1883 RepID=UPI001601F28D|nr:STM4014 family protein [Streptomyces murinus]MBA9043700.1 glutathione synthase/RimK-type ligase-like ATP-grasp enzyme [Streptomyces murinus]
MSPSPNNRAPGAGLRFAVVGNPENRRTTMFADAVRAAGHPAPRVLAWRDVLRGQYDFARGEWVRIDSPGENAEVDLLLRDVDEPTRVEGTALWYRRFTSAVRELTRAADRAGAVPSADPEEVAVMFDKRRCHARLAAAGVPLPPALSGPFDGWDGLRRQLKEARFSRAFVKAAHGSSASGVLALSIAGPGRVKATTSVERTEDGRLYNSLRVRDYTSEREVAALVDALVPDGVHVERWLPKAMSGGRAADLRVVVVAGRATHAVVRTSRHPMTNLHLGGARGDLDAVRTAIRAAGGDFAEVLEVAERAAGCFPGTLCVGVDILPATGWRRFTVGEVNAFGDLLPRLTGLPGSGAEHLDTYAAQVAAARTALRPTEQVGRRPEHEEHHHDISA